MRRSTTRHTIALPGGLLARLALPLLIVGALLPACASSPKSHWLPYTEPTPRPRDPWVLRCVLDKHPRMLVVALDKDLWVAYDTQTCTLYKTWRGDVNFDGPVYTTVHGPQPTTRGDDLPDPTAGASWFLLQRDESATGNLPFDPRPAAVSFRSYRFVDGHMQLLYSLACPDGSAVDITETIEAAHPNAGGVEFVRQFDFDRWPGWHPCLLDKAEQREPPPDRITSKWNASLVDGEGVDEMEWCSDHPTTSRGSFVFRALTATLRVRHDVDLHVPPHGVPVASPEAETE